MKLVLISVLLFQAFHSVILQHSNPLKDPLVCGVPSCSTGNNKFKYETGKYQTYKYSIEARSIFNGTSKNESTLYIEAEVTLNFLTSCDGLLTLSDVTLREIAPRDNVDDPTSSNSQLFADMISEHSIRFAFKDGVISEICPAEEEKSWPLNFKRGILSLLQNSMKRFDLDYTGEEEDIRGTCPTSYKLIGAKETSLVIEKTKDLDQCTDRFSFQSVVQSTELPNKRRAKSEDILKSSSHCIISIDHNIYKEIFCRENFIIEPFSNNAAGASTTVIQRLVLKEEGERKNDPNEILRRTNLKFDYSMPKQPINGDLRTTRNLIKKLCKESQQDTPSSFSDLFGKFIYSLRSLSYPALSSIYSHSRMTCSNAKKHLLDALPYVNTDGSLQLMKDIILAGNVDNNTINDWMMSLAFIRNPSEDMMKSALVILNEKQFSSTVALSIASLTHTYCNVHVDCKSSGTVRSIVEHFENHLLNLIEVNGDEKDQDNIIVTMKSLSSIGLISEYFEEKLFKLVEDPNLDVGIRIAAVETFRRLPCEKTRSYFESIFKDQNQDSEVRIAAYLQVMKCPSYILVRTIAFNLRNEEVNQVGSFVWSHLHNLIKSANPLKVEIQSLLSEADLVEKFSNDIRKFSHNREGSIYFDEYNIGGNYETNVIFSPSSYIPRTAMLNLTVDLFGKSVNLLEIQGRMEGFERYFESLFGPKGKANVLKEKVEEYKMRWTRGVEDNSVIERNVQNIADKVNTVKNNPKIAFGYKVFGNDLKYSSYNGMGEIYEGLQNMNVFDYLRKLLSGKEINYKKASMFLDSNYIVATGSGLPLFLSAIGTGTVNIKLFGSLKPADFSKHKELDLVANFEPTASLDISAEMSLNSFYASTGIKLKTNMQSSVAVKGDLKIRGSRLVSVKFSLPKKNIKIFGARSELFVKQNNVDVSQHGLISKTVSNSICSWAALSNAIGLTLCMDYSFKNTSTNILAPSFVLSGPASFQIYIQKSDPTANIYLFEYKRVQGRDTNVVSLTFDTPESAVKRLIHANITLAKTSNNMTMLMQSSSGIILARGRVINTESEKYLQMTLDINDKKHLDVSVAYERLKKTNGFTYKPKVYLGVNGDRVMELQGSVDLISKRDISQYTVDLKFHTKRLTSKLFGYISKTESSAGTDLHLDYKFVNAREERVSFRFSGANRSRKNLAKIIGTCELQSTSYPKFNFNTNVTFQLDLSGTWFSGHSAHAVGSYQDKSNKISSNHHMKLFVESPNFTDINGDFEFFRDNEVLKIDIKATQDINDYEIFVSHNNTSEEEMHTNIRLKYKTKLYTLNTVVNTGDYYRITTELHLDQLRDVEFSVWVFNEELQKAIGFDINWDANRDPNQKLLVAANITKAADFNCNADLIVSYPGRTIIAKYQFELQKGKIDLLASVSWDDGKSLSINLNVIYRYENEIFFEISSRLNTPLDSWKNMKLAATFEHLANLYRLNGRASWDPRQEIALHLFGDYMANIDFNSYKYICSVESTLDRIPNINTTFTHVKNGTHYNTNVHLMYNPEFMIDVDSDWFLQSNSDFSNLTGVVKTLTPFEGLKKGIFQSKISYTKDKNLRGVAEFDLDHKKMLIDMKGRFKHLMDSMFIANVTTLDEKYQCQFKLSKKDRHFIALLSYPTGNLGTEIILVFNDLTDFNVKFFLATPVDFIQNVLVVGKLQPEEADFRIGWNTLLLGFSGVWHYVNIIDFEYLYKIYTPIKDFEENGLVGKLIVKEGLDFEISFKLSLYKFGVKLIGKPKPKPLKELGINSRNVYSSDRVYRNNGKDDDFLSWEGLIELDAILYPTMKGQLEIDQKGPLYVLQGKIHMPAGVATVFNAFEYRNMLSMSNELKILTPYKYLNTITSNFKLHIIDGKKYLFALGLIYQKDSKTVKTGVLTEYNTDRKDIDERIYNATLEVNTPFKAFPKLNLFGAFETEKNFYHTKLLFNTNRSDISLDTTMEIFPGDIGINSDFHIVTPLVVIPKCQLSILKLTSTENMLEIRLAIPEKLKSEVYFKSSWLLKSSDRFKTTLQLETPFTGLENTTVGVEFLSTDIRSTLWTYVNIKPIEMVVNSTLQDDVLTAESLLQFGTKRFPLTVNCKMQRTGPNQRQLDGTLLLRDKAFKINGTVNVIRTIPVKVLITFIPVDNNVPLTFQYDLEATLKGYELVGFLSYSTGVTRFKGDAVTNNKLNWEINLQVEPPDVTQKIDVYICTKSINNTASLDVAIQTQIPNIENPKFGLSVTSNDILRRVRGYFELSQAKGKADIDYIWLYWENMFVKAVGSYQNHDYSSSSALEIFYKNPEKSFQQLEAGGDIQIDRIWSAGTNVSLKLPGKNNIGLEGHLKIPNDFKETHSLFGELTYTENLSFINYLLKYRSSYPFRRYGSWSKIYLENKKNMTADAVVEWDGQEYRNIGNMKIQNKSMELNYKLKTPKYRNKQFFVAKVNYEGIGKHHNLTCKTFYPEDVSLAYGTIDYVELANMFGMFNISVPYKNLNFTAAHFKTETTPNVYNRYIKAFWANGTALLDSKCNIKMGTSISEKNYKGNLLVEMPLATRHIGNVDYEYDKKAELSIGRATVGYNGENVLEGKYNCLSKSQAGLKTDTIHVELLNKKIPIGADYVHRRGSDTPRDGYNAATVDNKYLHLYNIKNQSKFNVTSEINIRNYANGQAYSFSATHLNRTVRFKTDYSISEREYKQRSKLELSPTVWLGYDLILINNTVDDIFDAQTLLINMSYPRRNFTVQGSYNVSDSIVSTDGSLVWGKDSKSVEAALDWRRVGFHREQVELLLKHPSFEKDVSFLTTYGYGNSSIDGQLIIDYSRNPEHRVSLGMMAVDKSQVQAYNYTYNIWAQQNATDLYLNCFGYVNWSPIKSGTLHIADYKRSYLSLTRFMTFADVDLRQKEASAIKDTVSGKSSFWGKYGGTYPIYTANMTTTHGTNHTSGSFYVNFYDKLIHLNVNLTEDGTQSLHTYGVIPNARNAMFDIWRDYEDKRLTDVSYYLKLNHSRLIMSKLRWRPELISDVQSGIRSNALQMYYGALDEINNTRQFMRAQFVDSVDGIWQDARPFVNKYLVDLRNLTVIEEDFGYLKLFLNASYHNNEFYMKDISTVILNLFDDLSLKSHLQSLPKIIQELSAVMGASGNNIKKSITFVIEKIKLYYNTTTTFIHDLINGDPVKHLTEMLEKVVDRYDVFIKNAHVAVLQYMEKLWSETYNLIVQNWHQTLAVLEPTFLKFIHYLETIAWTTGKDFLDFLYIRKNKIIESAYFMEFTKFSRDVDRFYKDITGNNTIEAVYTYSTIAWNFLNEKYINHVPFGKELKAIMLEIFAELKQLEEVPSIKYAIDKSSETFDYVKYYYKYFEVEFRAHQFIRFVYRKISEMSITALEMENREREAKTKFVYDPNDGIMLMEQKLPMSWHAFNETPHFQEIPEIKLFYDVYKYLSTSESSFWSFYYDYKPYTDPGEWLPPFKGYAMLMGGKYYITFDKKHYEFRGSCTYLLSTDFVSRNFTLLVSYDQMGLSNQVIILINKTAVHLDILSDAVAIHRPGSGQPIIKLPTDIDGNYIYRESNIVTVENNGFSLQCNMKFQICLFEISGWHYGRTAGLWGSYNNEPYDDLLPSDKTATNTNDLSTFGDSWSVKDSCQTRVFTEQVTNDSVPLEIQTLCNELFRSKVSDLSACFSRIPKDNYLSMCLNSTDTLGACRSALSYIEMCNRENTPLNIPDSCIKCNLLNGSEISEGEFVRLQGSAVPRMADIVFIVEAKACNKDLRNNKNFNIVVESINQELSDLNITNNRYAVVVFGGDGVFNAPRSIVINSKTFTDARTVSDYIDNIPVGNGNADIYGAITFANKLIFRPGVSRNFILFPCSECQEHNMQHDYSTVHQLLFENSVSLHILMNSTFSVQGELRKKENKVPYGVDLNKAYTKKDIKKLEGDQVLRDSIRIPKSTLGLCFSLALETNGTLFSSKHLEVEKSARKFATVFAKRLSYSAVPKDCTDCECASLPNGLSFMECYPCTYPRSNIEQHIYFDDEDM
ncbi:apolipoprotein lipid transfer particle isoform X2 [Rhynchophorus ferrugineus]|uniref:apolipoprotein lipid transfer particle isoform X2 n=1 Tax=Rhynchophorus ferrugineus TaxID=354439 RepID=UPI003FCEBA43